MQLSMICNFPAPSCFLKIIQLPSTYPNTGSLVPFLSLQTRSWSIKGLAITKRCQFQLCLQWKLIQQWFPLKSRALVTSLALSSWCSLDVDPPNLPTWVHLHDGVMWTRHISFSPKEKILNFNQRRCKAPSKTSSDLLISSHCAKLLAKTDIVKGSFDMFHLMTVLYLWNQTNGHFKKLEQILKFTD